MKSVFATSSPEETGMLAECFASVLKGGEIICLYGPIGSGKTVFVQGLAKALGCPERPVSASFGLMRRYKGSFNFFHFDLFRLDSCDMDNLGLDECLADEKAAVIIEWAEAARGFLPEDRLELYFSLEGGDKRKIIAETSGKSSLVLLEKARLMWKRK